MMTSQADTIRMAGMRLGAGPADTVRMVSNPREITASFKVPTDFS